ncbi:sulfurtransferase [Leifsonia sp. ALI-44-B]|uniref:sulfurtransferase n=1 Tax=Leifsonia sp. ALI-44-B TaxID=1933776 RepID=UPI00097CB67F|nr:sulfurtransferase [Leifsonia sp. ALI-44-B]ONI61025.1 sulfurtransferase [Leifsonia sp. ALI-44-B]
MRNILITAPELATALDAGTLDGAPVRVLDVRWRLDRPDGRPAFAAGHIPGAVYVDLENELAAHVPAGQAPVDGRHPLPSIEALQASARVWGVDDGDAIVVYDDLKNMSSARAWWLLRWAGVADVRLLDGALDAWTAAGLPLETGLAGDGDNDTDAAQQGASRRETSHRETSLRGGVTLSPGHLPIIDIEEASRWPSSGTLLDARATERYRGDVEPIDPRAGHIPGAVSTPTAANVDAEGHFLSPDALRERFAAAGIAEDTPVATYCGSGVTAAHNAVALTLAGFNPALYPGSWSEWSNHSDRAAATGDAPH